MKNTATLFTVSDDIIYNIEVNLRILHSPTQDSQNSNLIHCKTEIHHNSPYFAITTIPVIYDENIIQEGIIVQCNKYTALYSLNNSFMIADFRQPRPESEMRLLSHIDTTKDYLEEDIDLIIKLCLSKSTFTKEICKRCKQMEKMSLQYDNNNSIDLRMKDLLFKFKNNGSLYEPSYYFNYTMKLLEFIRRMHNIQKVELFPFLRKFILVVLNYYRSDGLFGPHAAISFYLYHHYKMHVRCLPFDLSFEDEYHNSEEFYFMNFSFIENTISLTSQLALIWGYQSKCHKLFMDCVKSLNIKSQFEESLQIMKLRLRESTGASKEDFKNFTTFSREFFPNLIGAHPLSNQLLDYPISLSFIHELMRLKPLVAFPKEKNEVVKFSLPSSTLANVMLSEYMEYPETARYDFSNPQVTEYRSIIKEYFKSNQTNLEEYITNQDKIDIHLITEPIITSFYGITSLYITQFTNQYDFSKVDLHDLIYISVSKNNPYYVLEKGILYKGYNINTGKMKGRDQSPCFLVLAARDILSVEIPKSVTCISESAFANCKSLKRVTFEDDSLLKIIEDRAFFECHNLQEINFENAVFLKEIGDNAFQYSGITEIKFNKSSDLTRIGEFAFSSCKNLKKVEILAHSNIYRQSETELSIKSFAFYKSPISELKLSGVGSIYDYAFANTDLCNVVLPDSLNYIGSYVFDNCKLLKSISIPRNINYIPSGIFGKNRYVKINIRESIQSETKSQKVNKENEGLLPIFFHQHNLRSFFSNTASPTRLCSNVKNDPLAANGFAETVFPLIKKECEIIGDKNILFISPDRDFETNKLPYTTKRIFEGAFIRSKITEFNSKLFVNEKMPKIKTIYRLSFAYMINLEVVDLGDTEIENIPDFCFFHSTKLTKVKLPTTVKRIGRFAFAYTNLHRINLRNLTNLKEIKDYAFYKTQIKKFHVPPSVIYLGSFFYSVSFYQIPENIQNEQEDANPIQEPFNEYDGEDFEGEEEEEEENEDIEDNEYDESKDFDLNSNHGCKKIVHPDKCEIIFLEPSKLKTIECFAFYQSKFQKIKLPTSLRNIGSYAFARIDINPVKIPENVRRIPDGAFYCSLSLRRFESLNIDNINYIGSNSFTGTNLLHFEVPPNISFLSDYCFYQTKINNFDFTKSHKLHEIKRKAFNNKKLKAKLPITTTEIEKDSFDGGASYEIVDFIGEKVKQIIKSLKEERGDKFPGFDDYDEIVFLEDKTIDIKREENKIYPTKNKDKLEEEEEKPERLIDCIKKIDTKKDSKSPINFRSIRTSANKELTQIANGLPNVSNCYATILLYYEIASKQITHISLSYIDGVSESICSLLFEIDKFSDDIKDVLNRILSHFKLSFLKVEDIDILNNIKGYNFNSAYLPSHLYQETYSLCKELNLKISKYPSLFPIKDIELERLVTLTTVACIYIDIKIAEINYGNKRFKFSFKNEKERLTQLRLITKDDYFEMYLYFDKIKNTIITKQFLTKLDTEIKPIDGFIFLRSEPKMEDNKISLTYDFPLDYIIKDVLDSILRGSLKAGQDPYNNFMKIKCLLAYFDIFKECAEKKIASLDIGSRTLFLNNNLMPLFVCIPQTNKSNYDIDLELRRFWLLIYELLTNQNIDDLMKKVHDDKSISFDKLRIRREFDEMTIFNSKQKSELCQFFNNDVFQICFNSDKYNFEDKTTKEGAFNYMFQKFKTLWANLFQGINLDEKTMHEKKEVDKYIAEIVNY